jgi:hypothetical protein
MGKKQLEGPAEIKQLFLMKKERIKYLIVKLAS